MNSKQDIFRSINFTCIFLVLLFTLISFISFVFSSEDNKYRGSQLIASVESNEYKSWLLVSVILSIPSLGLRFLGLNAAFRYWVDDNQFNLKSETFQIIVILSIFLPNVLLYAMLCSSDQKSTTVDVSYIAQFQAAVVPTQTLVLIVTILCSIFEKQYATIYNSTNDTRFPIEQWTISFILSVIASKIFFIFVSIIPLQIGKIVCLMLSSLLYIIGSLIVLFMAFKATSQLTDQMRDFSFRQYEQMQTIHAMIAVALFAAYNLGCLIGTGQLTSESAFLGQNSYSLVAILAGQIMLTIYLLVTEQQCLLFEVKVKRNQLQTQLNMSRYLSHEMRSPLNTTFLGLQILRGHMDNLLDLVKVSRKMLRGGKSTVVNLPKILQSMIKLAMEIDEVAETSKLIKESTAIALDTLNDMLTLDKIEENKLELELDSLDVWSFVSETVRPFRINAMKERVNLSVECLDLESDWPKRYEIIADKFKLKQVLRNFLSNAIKFCKNFEEGDGVGGEVKVYVEWFCKNSEQTHRLTKGQLFVRVSVSDNGCGLSAEQQAKLFGQYVQFNASKLQKGQGSGLGLWISKNLVKMHGGRIGVSSEGEGQGSTFFFELPLQEKRSPMADASLAQEEGLDILQPLPHILPRPSLSASLARVSPLSLPSLDGEDRPLERQIVSKKVGRLQSMVPVWLRLAFSSNLSAEDRDKIAANSNRSRSDRQHLYSSVADVETGLVSNSLKKTLISDQSTHMFGEVINSERGLAAVQEEKSDQDREKEREEKRSSSASATSGRGTPRILSERALRRQAYLTKFRNPGGDPLLAIEAEDCPPRRLHIIIVDDTVSTRKITAKIMEGLGHKVDQASDGIAFLKKIGVVATANHKAVGASETTSSCALLSSPNAGTVYDFVLMDDSMPLMCGPDATAAARAAGYNGLIFGLTGNTHSSLIENFTAKGADLVFTKPLDLERLQEAIKSRLPDRMGL